MSDLNNQVGEPVDNLSLLLVLQWIANCHSSYQYLKSFAYQLCSPIQLPIRPSVKMWRNRGIRIHVVSPLSFSFFSPFVVPHSIENLEKYLGEISQRPPELPSNLKNLSQSLNFFNFTPRTFNFYQKTPLRLFSPLNFFKIFKIPLILGFRFFL